MNNIVLIGMPASGKSTVGVVLAKIMGYQFIDSDLLIQEKDGRLLSRILEEDGPDQFNQIENEINSGIDAEKTVIATGGSVIYGKEAMDHFRKLGVVVYLRLPLPAIENRLGDLAERGISMRKGQTLSDIYDERTPLYEKFAHLEIDMDGLSIREAALTIRDKAERYLKINK